MEIDATSSSPSKYYKWREITDLPEDVDSLRDRELESLYEVWVEEKQRIADDSRVADFNAQISREWAIETGIIENVYTLDRGITQTLIEHGIDSAYISHEATNRDPELVARIIQAHHDVLEGLFSFIRSDRLLSVSYIKEMHSALLRHQDTFMVFDQLGRCFDTPLEKGAYKTMPNNPTQADGTIHEYCPPEHVASEMDRLIRIHQQQVSRGVSLHLQAAWIHHAFTQIHPFQDGNGRVARALASLVFIKGGYFPLVVNRDDRERYIDALVQADERDLSSLTRLFAQVQNRSLTRAIVKAADIKPAKSVEEALAATREMLVGLGKIGRKDYLESKDTATNLANNTLGRFSGLVRQLTEDISKVNQDFQFNVGTLGSAPVGEIRPIAEKLQYEANFNHYHQSVVLNLRSKAVESRIVISFHSVGAAFRGLLVVVGYFQNSNDAAVSLSEDVFRISYQDRLDDITPRFQKWLDGCIIEGLANWRRTLV